MKQVIHWNLDTGVAGASLGGTVEVEEGTTEAEIEAAVKDAVWRKISTSWSNAQPPRRRMFWRSGSERGRTDASHADAHR
ncbi:MAG: hypothetical protein JSR91_04585 [Proteobacteria bacterium]|nr:hypothetical protein [Pseudomonadota bacterium]